MNQMVKRRAKDPVEKLLQSILEGLRGKKAQHIICLDLGKIQSTVCDYFVICHGSSRTHAMALAEGVTEEVKKTLGIHPRRTEGFSNAEWILLDYLDVVVHVFQEPIRDFYQLEALWADAPAIDAGQESAKPQTAKKTSAKRSPSSRK